MIENSKEPNGSDSPRNLVNHRIDSRSWSLVTRNRDFFQPNKWYKCKQTVNGLPLMLRLGRRFGRISLLGFYLPMDLLYPGRAGLFWWRSVIPANLPPKKRRRFGNPRSQEKRPSWVFRGNWKSWGFSSLRNNRQLPPQKKQKMHVHDAQHSAIIIIYHYLSYTISNHCPSYCWWKKFLHIPDIHKTPTGAGFFPSTVSATFSRGAKDWKSWPYPTGVQANMLVYDFVACAWVPSVWSVGQSRFPPLFPACFNGKYVKCYLPVHWGTGGQLCPKKCIWKYVDNVWHSS